MDNIYVANGLEITPEIMHNDEEFYVIKYMGQCNGR